MIQTYKGYDEWRAAMTETAGFSLNPAYCQDRINALSNEQDPSTRAFLKAYGDAHRDQVVRWFEQALAES